MDWKRDVEIFFRNPNYDFHVMRKNIAYNDLSEYCSKNNMTVYCLYRFLPDIIRCPKCSKIIDMSDRVKFHDIEDELNGNYFRCSGDYYFWCPFCHYVENFPWKNIKDPNRIDKCVPTMYLIVKEGVTYPLPQLYSMTIWLPEEVL